jgi:hypothetical protein
VNHEGHDAGGQNIVAHPCVPGHPHLLKVVELHIVLGDLLKGAPVGILRHWRQDGGGVPAIAISTWRWAVGSFRGHTCWVRDSQGKQNAGVPGGSEGANDCKMVDCEDGDVQRGG